MTFRYHLYAEKGVKRTAVPKGHPLAAAVLPVKIKIEEVLKIHTIGRKHTGDNKTCRKAHWRWKRQNRVGQDKNAQ